MTGNSCPRCEQPTTDTGMTICERCATEMSRRIQWLENIGMPTLQQVVYRKASFGQRTLRSGNRAFAPTPINIEAQHVYLRAEEALQLIAGRLGLRPLGWDRLERPRTLRDWVYLCPKLEARLAEVAGLPDAGELADLLASACDGVQAKVTRAGERRLIGVCTDCLKVWRRTPIYAGSSDTYAVCPECGAFLSLNDVRIAYLKAAGLLHITRTQADAARWVRENTGVNVTGKDLRNWRNRGKMPSTRHAGGRYWAWNILELLACAEHRRERENGGIMP